MTYTQAPNHWLHMGANAQTTTVVGCVEHHLISHSSLVFRDLARRQQSEFLVEKHRKIQDGILHDMVSNAKMLSQTVRVLPSFCFVFTRRLHPSSLLVQYTAYLALKVPSTPGRLTFLPGFLTFFLPFFCPFSSLRFLRFSSRFFCFAALPCSTLVILSFHS